ncbi:MAG: DUF1015 domain-containing protein [Planctomycetota bacterium]
MAKVFPFRGVIYNKAKVIVRLPVKLSARGGCASGAQPTILGSNSLRSNCQSNDYGNVLTQPYDKIDDKMQAGYYKKHPFNLIRITKGKDLAGDSDANNKYTRAGEFFRKWLNQGVLVQDKKPAIYAYYQEFIPYGAKRNPDEHRGGQFIMKVRKGFIALGKLVEFGKGVHAHERTLLKPKMDRLSTMRQVHGSTGQIFMLYSDPKMTVNKIMDSVTLKHKPDVVARDEYGVYHKAWKITEPKLVNGIVKSMADKDIFIADGHHRYETALNYRNEMKAKGLKCAGNESYDNRMMTFVNMKDEGLLILPTHRLIFGLKSFSPASFIKKLDKYFWINEYPFKAFGKDEKTVRQELLEDLRITGFSAHALGLAIKGVKKYYMLTLKDEKMMDNVIKEKSSPALKHLDVNVLHQLVLGKMLGITKERVAEGEFVNYVRAADEAIALTQKGKYQMAFLLNPTKISELENVSVKNERMPQKSTDFYPKLLSGIVISKINYATTD